MIVKNLVFCQLWLLTSFFADAVSLPLYGGGSGQIHYFACNGAETDLLSCRRQRLCQYSQRAGVICFNGQLKSTFLHSVSIVSVAECDVRLVGGETPDDGWVEMCLEEKWGSLCVSNWDIREARVICRQLGYNGCRLNIEIFSDNLCQHLFNLLLLHHQMHLWYITSQVSIAMELNKC